MTKTLAETISRNDGFTADFWHYEDSETDASFYVAVLSFRGVAIGATSEKASLTEAEAALIALTDELADDAMAFAEEIAEGGNP